MGYASRKNVVEVSNGPVEEYLVLAHQGRKNEVVVSLSTRENLSDVMSQVKAKFASQVLGFGVIDMAGGISDAEINKYLSPKTGMNFDTGMFKIQVIPSSMQQYKMIKSMTNLKRGEVVKAFVSFA